MFVARKISYIVFKNVPQNTFMLIIFIRAIVIFVTLIIIMRLMGKRQIGEMQPFEFIITLLIAEVACVPMTDVSIPLIYGVVSIVAVFILHQLLTVFEQLSEPFKRVVDGKPAIVINKNGVDLKELKKNNMDVSDLIESLRGTGNFSLDSVYYAIYESNGKLSVLEKQTEEKDNSGELPLLLVTEGKIDKNNYNILKLDEKTFKNFLSKNRINSIKDIEVLTVTESGNAYLQTKGQTYRKTKLDLKED